MALSVQAASREAGRSSFGHVAVSNSGGTSQDPRAGTESGGITVPTTSMSEGEIQGRRARPRKAAIRFEDVQYRAAQKELRRTVVRQHAATMLPQEVDTAISLGGDGGDRGCDGDAAGMHMHVSVGYADSYDGSAAAAARSPAALAASPHPHARVPPMSPLESPGGGRKKRVAHTQEVITVLKEWLLSDEHVDNPYPTEAEKKVRHRATTCDYACNTPILLLSLCFPRQRS